MKLSEGILSQAEIDALLNDNSVSEMTDTAGNDELIDNAEVDAIGEVGNISMGTAATTLSSLLGKKVQITTPKVEVTNKGKIREQYPKPYVVIDVKYTDGLKGHNLLVISTKDAGIIADLMMGGTGENPPEELTELHMSAVSEAMNQMMGSASTSMSTVLNKRIDISPPILDLIDLQENDVGFEDIGSEEDIIKISFRMVIQGLVYSELMQLIPLKFAKNMIQDLFNNYSSGTEETILNTSGQPIEEPVPENYPSFSQESNYDSNEQMQQSQQAQQLQQSIAVQPAQFAQLNPQASQDKPQNLDLILDVPLQVSVELGRTNKSIREILEFSTGSIIELNKLAGEPVDMLINGKLFAKGEVVVIDENFGVRITDIVSPMERVKNLQ